jgi:hypothetical protein
VTYRLKASIDATRQVPGGEYTVRTPLGGTGPAAALSAGVIGFAAGALSGASFGVPFGEVESPRCLLLKNGDQALDVRLNGATDPVRLSAGGLMLLLQDEAASTEPLSAASVSLVTAQTEAGGLTFVIASGAEEIEPPYLVFVDSSPFVSGQASPNGNAAEIWKYRESQLVDGYSGPPSEIVRLPHPSFAGRGHGLCLPSSGGEFIVTSETDSEGNGGEVALFVPPGVTGALAPGSIPRRICSEIFAGTSSATMGLRDVIELGDGTFLVGTTGGTSPTRFANCTIEQLRAGDLEGLPLYEMPLRLDSYDHVTVPGTRRVWFNGDDQIALVDFSGSPGVATLLKIASGSNIGRPVNEFWYGFLALAPDGYLWKQRGAVPDLAGWSPATLEALTTTATNPAPDIVITSTSFTSLPSNESMISCLDFDKYGNLWAATNTSNRYQTLNVAESAHLFKFTAAQVAAGGSQVPAATITLPNWTQPWNMRCAPNVAAYPR